MLTRSSGCMFSGLRGHLINLGTFTRYYVRQITNSNAIRYALPLLLFALPAAAQWRPEGAVQDQLALSDLAVTGSVLMIAAHPDHENTALLAYLARGRHMRTAY